MIQFSIVVLKHQKYLFRTCHIIWNMLDCSQIYHLNAFFLCISRTFIIVSIILACLYQVAFLFLRKERCINCRKWSNWTFQFPTEFVPAKASLPPNYFHCDSAHTILGFGLGASATSDRSLGFSGGLGLKIGPLLTQYKTSSGPRQIVVSAITGRT